MAVIFVNSLPVSFLNAATGVATHNNIIKQLHCRYQLDIDCILLAQALGLLYHINFTLFISPALLLCQSLELKVTEMCRSHMKQMVTTWCTVLNWMNV